MDFDLSEEQQMLADTVERLVRNTYGFERREAFYQSPEGYSPEFWRQLSELGIASVPISADYDGFGGSGIENMLVMKALGHGLCRSPICIPRSTVPDWSSTSELPNSANGYCLRLLLANAGWR